MPYENPFVSRLIRLQQDGKEAISRPSNWREPPLLEVGTRADDELERLIDALVPSDALPDAGRWHWLIGSPGNGKSARLGLLARRLLDRGLKVVREDGTDALDAADDSQVPYLLLVREAGKAFPFAYLVQDASVVRDPFREVCDPTDDLADVLEQAVERGLSVLLCTNWGVLQRLFDRGLCDRSVREATWFRAVREAVDRGTGRVVLQATGKNAVFRDLAVTYEYLDNER